MRGATLAPSVEPGRHRGGGRRGRRRLARASNASWQPLPLGRDDRRSARAATSCPPSSPSGAITDWGRSERVEGALDRTIYDFLYHLWFRCEVEGIENVPSEGGALLVSNHAGALPPDAADDRQGDQGGAPAPAAAPPDDGALLQGLSRASACCCRRSAACPRTRPTSTACCADEEQLVLVFPEGAQGHREALQGPLPPAPLRPRRLRQGGDEGAGADRPDRGRRRRGGPAGLRADPAARRSSPGLIYAPVAPLFYLPAKFTIRFLEPIPHRRAWASEPWEDRGLVQTVSQDIRARIQEELFDMVGKRESVWFG